MTSTTADSTTIIDYFFANVKKLGNRCFLTQPMGVGNAVQQWSFNQVLDESQRMAAYLESLKLQPKSHIAILSKNCAWWILADLAIIMAGHVSVPVYPTLTADTTKFILEHSESILLFVGKLDKGPWEAMKAGIPKGMHTISFPISPENCAKTRWAEIIAEYEPIKSPVKRSPDEMCTIIYTSGTTGM
jgi:long-chain acyl-CoA synthetase